MEPTLLIKIPVFLTAKHLVVYKKDGVNQLLDFRLYLVSGQR